MDPLRDIRLKLIGLHSRIMGPRYDSLTESQKVALHQEEWDLEQVLKSLQAEVRHARYTYLITFTKRPEVSSDYWFSRLVKQLERKFVISFKASLEHVNSNLHAHVVVQSTQFLKKQHFSSFPGHVDIKKIIKDNGVYSYISKENKIFDDIISLKNFYGRISSEKLS